MGFTLTYQMRYGEGVAFAGGDRFEGSQKENRSVLLDSKVDSYVKTKSQVMIRRTFVNGLYSQSLRELPGLGTPAASAQAFLKNASSPQMAADRARRRYTLYSTLVGFTFGLPGYASAPVTVPANVTGVLILQLHMCAVIAVIGGRDPEDEDVREQSVQCVLYSTSESESSGWKGFAQRVGVKIGERGVRYASEKAVRWVGRRTRALPLIGGVIGGYSDLHSTQAVGRRATKLFLTEPGE